MANNVAQLTESAIGNYASYAAYVAQTLQAEPSGTISQIPNELKSVASEIAILVDPVRIDAFKSAVADQMNRQSSGPTFVNLASRISDMQISTTASGAGTLTVTVSDPDWQLLTQVKDGHTFIEADDTGYLWPPIDVNFPTGTDCWWRLCQINPTTDYTQANVTLTFEDRQVAWLREINAQMGGVAQAAPDSTLGGWLKQLVDGANKYLRKHPASRGRDYKPIRLVELVAPSDPNYTPPVQAPASSSPQKALSRQNPNKAKKGLTKSQEAYVMKWAPGGPASNSTTGAGNGLLMSTAEGN